MEAKIWTVIYGKYAGFQKKALNLLNAEIKDKYNGYLPFYSADSAEKSLLEESNLIIVGTKSDNSILRVLSESGEINVPEKAQGYSVCVKDSAFNPQRQMMVLCGSDEAGVLYGTVDFVNKYLGYAIYKTGNGYMEYDAYFKTPFTERAPEWCEESYPAVETRGIWTWGHTIYDYRAFFDNMVRLKLNEVVIWNDYAPINAADVLEYAHSLGIKVLWGFAWGWGTDCESSMSLDDESLKRLKAEIIEKYEREYASCGCDGIYFQSCTELRCEYIGDKLIADVVVDFVNDTAGELLKRYPSIRIQFGLHSQSVKDRLEYIKTTDPRVSIVWENCGAFPFYSNDVDHGYESDVGDIDKTIEFTDKISTLRSHDELFGLVLKGMCTLDWSTFEHQPKNIILGERTDRFIARRTAEKHRIWKLRQVNWVRNCDYVQRLVKSLRKGVEVQAVLEDGMLEEEIPLSAAIYAETLWNPDREGREILAEVMKYPCVKIANI